MSAIDRVLGRERAAPVDLDQRGDALAAAEEAEAEAAEAEARAAAAMARAQAIRRRLEAEPPPDRPDDPEIDAAHGSDDAASATTRRGRLWRRPSWRAMLAGGMAAASVAALLAATGYMVWHDHRISEQRHREVEFAAAARQGVVNLMSLDFNRAKDDVQRIIDSSTGAFKNDFQATADDLVTSARNARAVSNTIVNATAVESMNGNSAVVLVAATSTLTNAAGAKDEKRSWRLSVTVTQDGAQLKIAKVDFVP